MTLGASVMRKVWTHQEVGWAPSPAMHHKPLKTPLKDADSGSPKKLTALCCIQLLPISTSALCWSLSCSMMLKGLFHICINRGKAVPCQL